MEESHLIQHHMTTDDDVFERKQHIDRQQGLLSVVRELSETYHSTNTHAQVSIPRISDRSSLAFVSQAQITTLLYLQQAISGSYLTYQEREEYS